MAKATQALAFHGWPQEGRTLGEIVEQMVGINAWLLLTKATDGSKYIAHLAPAAATSPDPNNRQWVEALNACCPLLDFWNSGALIAKGRREDPLAFPVEIAPPSIGWEIWVVSFTRSIIRDPADGEIYDLRFFLPEPKTDSAPADNTGPDPFRTGAAGRPSAAAIVLAEAERRIRDKEVTPKQGGLTAFSTDLKNWWEEKRHTYNPDPGPRMTASGIRSCGVRDLWNAALRGVRN